MDFPAVWREEAGLDSILQAAGRCNREGRRAADSSPVTVFRLQGQRVPAMIRPQRGRGAVCVRCLSPTRLGRKPSRHTSPFSVRSAGTPALDRDHILDAFRRGIGGLHAPLCHSGGSVPFDRQPHHRRLSSSGRGRRPGRCPARRAGRPDLVPPVGAVRGQCLSRASAEAAGHRRPGHRARRQLHSKTSCPCTIAAPAFPWMSRPARRGSHKPDTEKGGKDTLPPLFLKIHATISIHGAMPTGLL